MSAAGELDVFSCSLDGINLIEASAGTGKTWNICGLYLRLLLERKLAALQVEHDLLKKAIRFNIERRRRNSSS